MSPTPNKPRIALGADHAGFRTKEVIKDFLRRHGYTFDDAGTQSEQSVDYPDYARAVAQRVSSGAAQVGILVCGTGIGMAITANKVSGIRAATVHDVSTAHLAREHNDANVLALGARVVSDDVAVSIVSEFLSTPFGGGRHQPRVDKINALDSERAEARR